MQPQYKGPRHDKYRPRLSNHRKHAMVSIEKFVRCNVHRAYILEQSENAQLILNML